MKRKNLDQGKGTEAKKREGEGKRVYLGNLSFKVDEGAIKKAFEGCGKIASVDFITDYATGKFYGTAFANFETADGARRAVSMNGQKLLGRPMKVEIPKPPVKESHVDKTPGVRSVFVSRLPRDVDEDAVWNEFGKAGTVTGIRWVEPSSESQTVCCGFVEFETEDGAAKAVEMFHGSDVLGARGHLRVNLAPDRPYRSKVLQQGEGDEQPKGAEDDEEAPVIPKPEKPKVVISAAAGATVTKKT